MTQMSLCACIIPTRRPNCVKKQKDRIIFFLPVKLTLTLFECATISIRGQDSSSQRKSAKCKAADRYAIRQRCKRATLQVQLPLSGTFASASTRRRLHDVLPGLVGRLYRLDRHAAVQQWRGWHPKGGSVCQCVCIGVCVVVVEEEEWLEGGACMQKETPREEVRLVPLVNKRR